MIDDRVMAGKSERERGMRQVRKKSSFSNKLQVVHHSPCCFIVVVGVSFSQRRKLLVFSVRNKQADFDYLFGVVSGKKHVV